ncbi:hypothetical protein CPB83DRAFT_861235 [Crepidotus variabilis]|uniref:Chromatin modification-related protein n=1 Tax=Crepidotus variabilis TaxID=179855 RepID=A0A9P6E8N1_9AGAR|nr:hypothetical protein CPB83DRAFT_861235 [Crepidotus variabilis]
MAAVVPNFEEASNVATEYIYGIDNLPSEVSHILQEIKHRDVRTAELQNEIDRDAARYIRHSRPGTIPSTPVPDSPPAFSSRRESVGPNGAPIPIPQKIQASYTEIHELASEKCLLAQRLVDLISRARSKLDVDITRVKLLQGEPPELVAAQASAIIHMKPPGLMVLPSLSASAPIAVSSSADSFGAPGRNPALAISESLRNALAQPPAAERAAVSAAASPAPLTGHANKKRRTTTNTSIKISPAASPTKHRSASPASATPAAHTQIKSRLSRQVHPPPPEEDDHDLDGEGEDEDADAEEDNEDETLYCFCQKQSYGDMIACDNEGACPYEWFHLACVGLKQPPAEKWFCSVCAKTKGLTTGTTTTSRKGRKK